MTTRVNHPPITLRRHLRDLFALVLILVPLFAVNARWGESANIDVTAAAAPSWRLVEAGTLDMTQYESQNPWFVVDRKGRLVSDRPPGLIAASLPMYFLWRVDPFTHAPATLTSLLATLAAVLIVWWLALPLVGRGAALVGALTLAIGTTTWSISSAQMWPHGIGQLMAMLTVAGLAAHRYLAAGLASATAITIRPITAVYSALIGLGMAWRSRELRIAVKYGATAVSGVIAVVVYNRLIFGQWTLRGGHEAGLLGGFGGDYGPRAYLANLSATFVGLRHGLFTLSPIVLTATVGAVMNRSRIHGWAKTAALSGLGYLLVHAAFNRASGGAELFYRYPLEALALASVALIVGAAEWYRESTMGRWLIMSTAIFSVSMQFVNVFYVSCLRANPETLACFLV